MDGTGEGRRESWLRRKAAMRFGHGRAGGEKRKMYGRGAECRRADTRALSRCDARWCEGAAACRARRLRFLDEPAHLLRGASARHRNLWRRSRARSVLRRRVRPGGDGASSLQRSGPAPANGLPRKGRTSASLAPLLAAAAVLGGLRRGGVALSSAPGHLNGPGMGFSPRCSERAPAVSSPSSPGLGIGRRRFRHAGDSRGAVRGALRAMGSLRGCGVHGGGGHGRARRSVAAAVVVVLARVR